MFNQYNYIVGSAASGKSLFMREIFKNCPFAVYIDCDSSYNKETFGKDHYYINTNIESDIVDTCNKIENADIFIDGLNSISFGVNNRYTPSYVLIRKLVKSLSDKNRYFLSFHKSLTNQSFPHLEGKVFNVIKVDRECYIDLDSNRIGIGDIKSYFRNEKIKKIIG